MRRRTDRQFSSGPISATSPSSRFASRASSWIPAFPARWLSTWSDRTGPDLVINATDTIVGTSGRLAELHGVLHEVGTIEFPTGPLGTYSGHVESPWSNGGATRTW